MNTPGPGWGDTVIEWFVTGKSHDSYSLACTAHGSGVDCDKARYQHVNNPFILLSYELLEHGFPVNTALK